MADILASIEQLALVRVLKTSFVAYPIVNALHILSIGALLTSVMLMDLRIVGAFRSVPRRTVDRTVAPHGACGVRRRVDHRLAAVFGQGPRLRGDADLPRQDGAGPSRRRELHRFPAASSPEATMSAARTVTALAILSLVLWISVLFAGRFIGFVSITLSMLARRLGLRLSVAAETFGRGTENRCAGKCFITTTSRVSASSTATDGKRYTFERGDLRRLVPVTKGTPVEFQVDGANGARNLRRARQRHARSAARLAVRPRRRRGRAGQHRAVELFRARADDQLRQFQRPRAPQGILGLRSILDDLLHDRLRTGGLYDDNAIGQSGCRQRRVSCHNHRGGRPSLSWRPSSLASRSRSAASTTSACRAGSICWSSCPISAI